MGRVEELKKELAELEAKEKENNEIKDLERQIHAKKFSQSKSGKVFNKIADIGDGLGKAVMGAGSSGKSKGVFSEDKPKKRVKTLQEVMDEMPQ